MTPYPDEPPKFTEQQIMWIEDLVVNALCPLWTPRRGKDCHGCIQAAERVIEAVRGLRE